MAITLTDIITRVRQRSGHVADQFVTDVELTGWINASLVALWGRIIAAGADYAITLSTTIPTAIGSPSYPLPSDFYRLRGVTALWGTNQHEPVEPIEYRERTLYENASWGGQYGCLFGYMLFPPNIVVFPTPQSVVSLRIEYIQSAKTLVNPGDSFPTMNGWDEFVTADVAAKICVKEQTDPSGHLFFRDDASTRIITEASALRVEPARISQVEQFRGFGRRRFLPGWR